MNNEKEVSCVADIEGTFVRDKRVCGYVDFKGDVRFSPHGNFFLFPEFGSL